MGKIVNQAALLIALVLFGLSCKKDFNTDEGLEFPTDQKLADAQVVLPAGSNYHLNNHEIFHRAHSLPVGQSGKTKVIKPKQNISIAYLLNADQKPVLAGFITDSTTTISVESTAKVLLYLAIGVPFMEDTLAHVFVNRVHEVPGLADWINDFTQAWKADPLAFSSGSYREKLHAWLEEKNQVPSTAGNRVGSVNVNSNDVRSGLRLSAENLGISFTNSYRRRSSAFFYKMGYKETGNNNYVSLIASVNDNSKFETVKKLDPVSGVTSVSGEVWKQITDKGTQSFAVTTGPFVFELKDNESEGYFRARVVGLGSVDPGMLTVTETTELFEIYGWSAFEAGCSVIGAAMGASRTDHQDDDFINALIVDIPKVMPGFFELLMWGEFKKAFLGLINALCSEHGYDLLVAIAKAGFDPKDIPVSFEKQVQKGAFILQAIDLALLGGDFVRLVADAYSSRGLEEWDFTIRAGKVTLTPNESVVSIYSPANKQEIEAKVQNLSDADIGKVMYQWNVLTSFGTIADGLGNSGTSFQSPSKKVSFTSRNDPGLTDGDNWAAVYVVATLNGSEIGSDTVKINVKKTRYQLQPDGVTISGREGQTNRVQLRLLAVSNGQQIVPNDDVDFKVVWETTGAYGGLTAGFTANAKTITMYDENSLVYECNNDQVKNGTETITARIFAKQKNQPGMQYRLVDIVTGKIFINNDEKKKIVHVPIVCAHGDSIYGPAPSITCMRISYASVSAEKDAQSYSVRFYNVSRPSTYSWNASGPGPTLPHYVVPPSDGVFNVEYVAGWTVGALSLVTHGSCDRMPTGMAEVIITLK